MSDVSVQSDSASVTLPPKAELMAMLRRMWEIRIFEDTVYDLLGRDVIKGASHLYAGEEAVAVVQADVADDWDLNGSYQEFEVLQHNRVKADPDELAVAGVVKNVGDTTAEWITVVMTAYGDDGAVVGAGEAYIEIDELAAGLESPFTVRVTLTAPAADYRLQVEGSPAD